jgi:GTP-binding protein
MTNTPIVAIIGRPNVGKSTLFNRLAGERIAVESEQEGTTRDRVYAPVNWRLRNFLLVDTAGLTTKVDDLQEQIEIALEESDIILFAIDLSSDITTLDKSVADKLRKQTKPVILVGNKSDRLRSSYDSVESLRLGFGAAIPVSSIHGRGTGELLDSVTKLLPEQVSDSPDEDVIPVALIGRPNVGKSTLLNWLSPGRRAVTSPVPGTTRDVISTTVDYESSKISLLDTAGIRRRGKIESGIERWSVLRSLRALESAEIVLLVLDYSEGPTAGDAHLAGAAKDAAKGIIIIVNKWDLSPKGLTQEEVTARLRRIFDFIPYASVIFTRALSGGDPEPILKSIVKIHEERLRRIDTHTLNDFLGEVTSRKRPAGLGRSQPKLKYMTQRAVNPPTFTFSGRGTDKLHFSYKRFLENQLRSHFGFVSTAIRLEFKEDKGATHRRSR